MARRHAENTPIAPAASAFVEAIGTDPDDDASRLVYADWLDDHGEADRAEFIRLQCRLARLAEDDPDRPALARRERELLHDRRKDWETTLPRLKGIKWGRFERGFVAEVTASEVSALWKHLPAIVRTTPVQHVTLGSGPPEGAEQLAESPYLAGLRSLIYDGSYLPTDPDVVRALVASPHLARLHTLDLYNTRLAAREAVALSRGAFRDLRTLVLDYNDLGNKGAEALAASPVLANLEHLLIESNDIGEAGGVALGSSPYLTRLVRLELHCNKLGPRAARAFAEGPPRPALRHFSIGSNDIKNAGAVALAGWPTLRQFDYLCLSWNPCKAAGLRLLADSPHLARLDRLVLGCDKTDDVIDYREQMMPGLCNLYRNEIGLPGIRALAGSPYLAGIRSLETWCNSADEEAVEYLRSRHPRAKLCGGSSPP
jgi:uncharacterized protein (TIGR02996 family)